MRYTRLTMKEDLATGELGLILDGIRMLNTPMVSLSGMGIAHDIMEHQNGTRAIGSVGDEVEALGGMWFVRGEQNDTRMEENGIYRRTDMVDTVAGDLAHLCSIFMRGVPLRVAVPATRKHHCDAKFDASIAEGKMVYMNDYSNEFKNVDKNRVNAFFEYAKHLLRTGYRKASVRFNQNNDEANAQFWAIATAVNDVLAYEGDIEGQQFVLGYGDCRATFKEFYERQW